MAVSGMHRGWIYSPNNGILSASLIGPVKAGQTALATNTALDGILLGTPITPAVALNTIIISNLVASGDILIAANNGGNSQAWLWIDASASTMTIYSAGVARAEIGSSYVQLLDTVLLGIGTGNTARLSWGTSDANANELLLQLPPGGAVDVPVIVIGQSIETLDLGLYNGVVDPRIAIFGVGAVTTGPVIEFRKARGTVAAPTVVTSGDDVGTIRGYAAVAAGEYVQTAEIRFDCAGTIGTTRGPGTITFLTATDAAPSVLTQAMIISAAQKVTIASGESTGDFKLNLTLTAGADGVGTSGEQLTSGGAAAETNWAAAASLREYKELEGLADQREALEAVLNAPVYNFHYRKGARGTKDYDTQYVGVVADEAPWAMHYHGRILNPINTFGYAVLAIQALQAQIDELKRGRKGN